MLVDKFSELFFQLWEWKAFSQWAILNLSREEFSSFPLSLFFFNSFSAIKHGYNDTFKKKPIIIKKSFLVTASAGIFLW